ncbi:hypothetical protein BH23CHL2_BH23CHL2_14180 [soil metagenome]
MARDLLRHPARIALYAVIIAGLVILLIEILINSSVLFLVGNGLIGVSFVAWGVAYLTNPGLIGPLKAPRDSRSLGYLFIAMGSITLVLIVGRNLIG